MAYTTDQYIKEHAARIEKLVNASGLAIGSVHADVVVRIFDEGKSGSGKIGTYNKTKPLYINPRTAPKNVSVKGKTGQTTFKNGKKHKTAFFPSYSAFRGAIGRNPNNVDLKLVGTLQSDFSNSLQQQGLTWQTGVSNNANTKKVSGIIKKYGNVFKVSDKEREKLIHILKEERLRLKV